MFSSLSSRFATTLITLLTASSVASAERVIQSSSLITCQENSGLTAQYFNVIFTPNNGTLQFGINGISTIRTFVVAELDVTAYGYPVYQKSNLNPCDESLDLQGLCPMSTGIIKSEKNIIKIDMDTVTQIPGIAYSIPDLDGLVQIKLYQFDNDTKAIGAQVACVQANLSNGKTVYQKGVGWSSAIIAGLALLTSAIVAGLGHSNTATHVAANTMSLFGFFQAQAIFGMTAVPLPPIVQSWTQNFQWSMGIIRVSFLQDIAFWYQQATGGHPTTILSMILRTSVDVQKRALNQVSRGTMWAMEHGEKLVKRADQSQTDPGPPVIVRGIERVGFRAGIEPSNIFLTGYIFFIIFVMFIPLAVIIFRFILEGLARSGKMKSDKFQDFRNGWTTVLRGILYRMVFIGFPQMTILCFWELTHRDSAGEIALAVVMIGTMLVMLVWACAKVWRLASRSISMHKNPAYILYSDPVCLHKWGFLYVQFKATAYWFIIPLLSFIFVTGLFVAFAQGSGIAQAVAMIVLNASFLIGISILRPYMDKKTNAFNISIASINLVSSIFLLFFTDVFGLPPLVRGVMGIIFFIMNAVFALVLLLMVLVATCYAIFSKNPDVRYQPMRDDRGSFIKSQSQLTTELDALGATARGEAKTPYYKREFDADSYESMEERRGNYGPLAGTYGRAPGSQKNLTAYESSPFRSGSMTSSISQQAPPRVASPWQRGAGYDH